MRRRTPRSTLSSSSAASDVYKRQVLGDGRNEIVDSKPYRSYTGHKKEVLDTAWSAGNFLLSASMDKTVRLWHVLRAECLATFRHNGYVTAVAFHPKDERYFLSASYQEMRLRLFNIPDKKCVEWAPTNAWCTSAGFSSDGHMALAGCYNGMCKFYQTEGLKFITEFDACAGKRERPDDRKKVTGVDWVGDQLLVTTNDCRLRLFDTRDYSLVCKYIGLSNTDIPVKASFSQGGKYIVCSSEDMTVYVWNTVNDFKPGLFQSRAREDHNESNEAFKASNVMVTSAVFAPWSVPALEFDSSGNNSPQESEQALGQVLLTADWNGVIKVYEVTRPPKIYG
eukprot:TRINITY_DN31583_c0_g1_i1.p1 TRINITY_DN31583_c0_g1~~TRINITY_DN31583_c0_g1_i1.p1  ORF type:complete len:338 (+),score=60.89 TRINITY_DN31583_c0_g1_i1:43-1056(+)